MFNYKEIANKMKTVARGLEMRPLIVQATESIGEMAEDIGSKQKKLENTFDQLIINAGNSNAENVAARVKADGTTYETIGKRMDDVDSQLEQNMNKINEQFNTIQSDYNNKINEVASTGTTTEVLKNTTETYIQEKIEDGTIANLTIKDDTITKNKLESDFADSINTTTETLNNCSNDNILELVDANDNIGYYIDDVGNTSHLQLAKTGDNHIEICDDNGNVGFKIYNNPVKLKHIIVTGQSLGAGAEGAPCLTPNPISLFRGKNLMFNGGARITDLVGEYGSNATGKVVTTDLLQYLEDIHERDAGAYGETICTSMLTQGNNGRELLLCTNVAVGGRAYSELKRGTIPYSNSILAITRGKEIAEKLGYDYEVPVICVVHGEADLFNTSYKDNILEWYNNYNEDIKKITEQPNDIKFLMSQTISMPINYNPEGGDRKAKSALDVYNASKENTNIIIPCAQYTQLYEEYNIHMSEYGYRNLGEYFGLALNQTLDILRDDYKPLKPSLITLSGNKVTLKYDVEYKPLVIDTSLSNNPAFANNCCGFKVHADNSPNITNVEIQNSDTVVLTLSEIPTGTVSVSYAYDVAEGNTIGKNANRGHIRDSRKVKSYFDDSYLYNWGIIFKEQIQ